MISPKLHAIWPVLFLNLPQDLIVILLMYLGTLGDGWETARRRTPGNDWVIVALGHPGEIEKIIVFVSDS